MFPWSNHDGKKNRKINYDKLWLHIPNILLAVNYLYQHKQIVTRYLQEIIIHQKLFIMPMYFYGLKKVTVLLLLSVPVLFSNCYSYRVATQAQAGTETSKTITAHALFWGLIKKPTEINSPKSNFFFIIICFNLKQI